MHFSERKPLRYGRLTTACFYWEKKEPYISGQFSMGGEDLFPQGQQSRTHISTYVKCKVLVNDLGFCWQPLGWRVDAFKSEVSS